MDLYTSFIFIIHFHQPVGQPRKVVDRIHRNSYELLLRIFEDFPETGFTLHFSGPLLRYWSLYYQDFLEDLREIVRREQVEVLGGSFGESILAILPEEDRVEQLRRGRRLVEDTLGVAPRGAWLPERVWDPTLPPAFNEAGYEYVVVDDEIGYKVGLWKGDVHRAWLTEYSGKSLGVFFIDTPIRYTLPWRSHEEVFGYLRGQRTEGGSEYVLWGSDAEKFGEWWDPALAEKWLRKFLEASSSCEWLQIVTPSQYLRRHGYRGLVYLPPGSYDKMLEWSGGYFPNFMRKYVESNNLHKKMLYVREKLASLKAPEEAWESYYLAQCNDAYWHGLFGGLYIGFLRQAVYEHLIRAERIAEENAGLYTDMGVVIEERDFDFDGGNEVLMESRYINAYIKPGDGGTLFELDYKEGGREHNLLNSMSRYAESYLESVRNYRPDWYRRVCFRDHIWREGTSIWDWINNTPFTDVSDLATASYIYELGRDAVRLSRVGRDWSDRENPRRILVEKEFRLETSKGGLEVEYYWRNIEKHRASYNLSVELTIAPWINHEDPDRNCHYVIDDKNSHNVKEPYVSPSSGKIAIFSEGYCAISVSSAKKADLWVAPVNTLSRTEKGIKESFQALGLAFNYKVPLDPGEYFATKLRISVG